MSRISRQKQASRRAAAGPPHATRANERLVLAAISAGLAVAVFVAFGGTLHHAFINFDDPVYVIDNPEVSAGLTAHGIAWAFSHVYASNWHPLTWLSHMLDCQVYGLNAGGHHFTSVLLHAATAILLFRLLQSLTGQMWRSAFAAALFALHPLRVESVAWIAERKDVLSGLFFVLTTWMYVRYARSAPNVDATANAGRRSPTRRYIWMLVFFACGLMAKPMLVTLPLVLLLLDYWPLRRFPAAGGTVPVTRLLAEKLPLLALAGLASGVTLLAQTTARKSLEEITLPARVGNALVSYTTYVEQMLWPTRLAVLYPFSASDIGPARLVVAAIVLVGVSVAAVALRRRRPYLLVGWAWYAIMLIPVSGLVWVGAQAHADRYTYLPEIGLGVALTWGVAELGVARNAQRKILGTVAAIVLVALLVATRRQSAFWRESVTLWTHTLACTSDNSVAHNNLANALVRAGDADAAIPHYEAALQIKPEYAEAHYNLGSALLGKGQVDEAIGHYHTALQLDPSYVDAHNNLGNALSSQQRWDEAIAEYRAALQLKPAIGITHVNLGTALARKGLRNEAIAQFRRAIELDPNLAEAHYNLSRALAESGDDAEAMAHYQKAVELRQAARGGAGLAPRF